MYNAGHFFPPLSPSLRVLIIFRRGILAGREERKFSADHLMIYLRRWREPMILATGSMVHIA